MTLAVGDTGLFQQTFRRNMEPSPATIVRVGRRWAYLTVDRYARHEIAVDKESGVEKGDMGAPGRFYTHEAWEHRQRMADARETIRGWGIEFRMGSSVRFDDEFVLSLAAWLDSTLAPR